MNNTEDTNNKKMIRLKELWDEGKSAHYLVINGRTLCEWWDTAEKRMHGTYWDSYPNGLTVLTARIVNKIRAIVESQVAIMVENLNIPSLRPVDTGGDVVYVLKTGGSKKIFAAIQTGVVIDPSLSDEQLGIDRSMTDFTVTGPNELGGREFITVDDYEGLTAVGMNPRDFYRIDDTALTRFAQRRYDWIWNKSGMRRALVENIDMNVVLGHQPAMFEFDVKKQRAKIYNPKVHNVVIDPECTDIDDALYLQFEQIVPVEAAIARWPKIDPKSFNATTSVSGTSRLAGTLHKREMVVVRHCWQVMDLPVADGGTRETVWYTAYVPDTETILDERECPYRIENEPVIPWLWNRNGFIVNSPYGLGTPANLESLAQTVNANLTYLTEEMRNAAWAQQIMPKSYYNEISKPDKNGRMSSPFRRPDKIHVIDDALFERMQGKHFHIPAPPLDMAKIEFLRLLLSLMDQHAENNADVLRGQMFSGASGKLAEQLTQNARGSVGLRSILGNIAVHRLGMMLLTAMIKYWPEPENDVMKDTEYPPHIAKLLIARLRNTAWDVEVSDSNTSTKMQLMEEVAFKKREGIISPETAALRLDEDPHVEQGKMADAINAQQNNGGMPINTSRSPAPDVPVTG